MPRGRPAIKWTLEQVAGHIVHHDPDHFNLERERSREAELQSACERDYLASLGDDQLLALEALLFSEQKTGQDAFQIPTDLDVDILRSHVAARYFEAIDIDNAEVVPSVIHKALKPNECVFLGQVFLALGRRDVLFLREATEEWPPIRRKLLNAGLSPVPAELGPPPSQWLVLWRQFIAERIDGRPIDLLDRVALLLDHKGVVADETGLYLRSEVVRHFEAKAKSKRASVPGERGSADRADLRRLTSVILRSEPSPALIELMNCYRDLHNAARRAKRGDDQARQIALRTSERIIEFFSLPGDDVELFELLFDRAFAAKTPGSHPHGKSRTHNLIVTALADARSHLVYEKGRWGEDDPVLQTRIAAWEAALHKPRQYRPRG